MGQFDKLKQSLHESRNDMFGLENNGPDSAEYAAYAEGYIDALEWVLGEIGHLELENGSN